MPKRYITRDIKNDELSGVWKITEYSYKRLTEFKKRFPSWTIFSPFIEINLFPDGSAKIVPDKKYLDPIFDESFDLDKLLTNGYLNASWKILKEKISDYDYTIQTYIIKHYCPKVYHKYASFSTIPLSGISNRFVISKKTSILSCNAS